MTPRKPKTMKMQQIGHYRPPSIKGPGHYNRPRVGRIGKNMPSIKQFRPLMGKKS